MLKLTRVALLVGSLLTSGQTFAQETSSGIRGQVVDASGNPISNTIVELIHMPTGSTKVLTSSENGVFRSSGLTVGGPYMVKLQDGSSYTADAITDLFLQLSKTAPVTLVVTPNNNDVEKIQVTGERIMTGAGQTGSAAEFGEDAIGKTASISRDIKSVLQTDSRFSLESGGNDGAQLSVAGNNFRFNSLTVDGVRQNDDFGLNRSGNPGRRSPISLDSVAQLSVNIAPFDVTYGSFQGANINVVTKSGTNDFHGSLAYYQSSDSMIGDKSKGEKINVGEFDEKTLVATIGGPIIEDKLFFFAAYDKFEATSPYPFTLGNGDGNATANEIDKITQAEFDQISEIAQRVYGINTQGFETSDTEEDEKILVKLDWNINDDHRASFTYQSNEGNKFRDFYANAALNRASALSGRYNTVDKLTTYSLHVFSDWTDDFSTEFKFGSKEVKNRQKALSDVGEMAITTPSGGTLHIGTDRFRHANELDNNFTTFKLKGIYYLNDYHTLTFGYEREQLEVDNLFVFASKGVGVYSSIARFEAMSPDFMLYQNHYSGNPRDAITSFELTTNTFYIQDEWTATDDLTVFYGLRYERLSNDDNPTFNQNFVNRHNTDNTFNMDGLDLVSPRVGFNWQYDDNTIIRGGFGIFGGGTPNVWLSNAYGDDGVQKAFIFLPNFDGSTLPNGWNGKDIPAVITNQLAPSNSATSSIDHNYKINSTWKYNLAWEHRTDLGFLGDDWTLTLEGLWSSVRHAAAYTELNTKQVATAPDGRPVYNTIPIQDLQLTNTGVGKSSVYSAGANKAWYLDSGIYRLGMGYTYQDVTEANPNNSFIAFEGYSEAAHSDFQSPRAFRSLYETKHRFTVNFSWEGEVFGSNLTTVSFNYFAQSGRPYSYTMSNDSLTFGGSAAGFNSWDGYRSQLLYVPTGASDEKVRFANAAQAAAFDTYISSDSCLSAHRGQIVPRFACTSPWYRRLDMRIVQEIAINDDYKFDVFFDIENLTNLLNDDWGRLQQFGYPYNAPLVNASFGAVNGQPNYSYYNYTFDGAPAQQVAQIPSLWKIQLGVKFSF